MLFSFSKPRKRTRPSFPGRHHGAGQRQVPRGHDVEAEGGRGRRHRGAEAGKPVSRTGKEGENRDSFRGTRWQTLFHVLKKYFFKYFTYIFFL